MPEPVTTPCPVCGRYHARGPSTVQIRERVKVMCRCARCSIALDWWREEPDDARRSRQDAAQRLEDRGSAAVFAYGFGDSIGAKVHVGYHPKSDPDADFLMAWGNDVLDWYVPVQLKDLRAEAGGDSIEALNKIIADVSVTYPRSPDL